MIKNNNYKKTILTAIMVIPLLTSGIAIGNFQDANAGPGITTPPGFYGSDRFGNIFLFDPNIPSVTPVGPTGTSFQSTEIECTSDGILCFSQGSGPSSVIEQVLLNPPFVIGPPVPDGAAFNGLEYVGATLYGTSTTSMVGDGTSVKPVTWKDGDEITKVATPVLVLILYRFPPSKLSPPAYSCPSGPNSRLPSVAPVFPTGLAKPVLRFTVQRAEGPAPPQPSTPYIIPADVSYASPDIGPPVKVGPIGIESPDNGSSIDKSENPHIDVDIDIKPGSDPNSINTICNGRQTRKYRW